MNNFKWIAGPAVGLYLVILGGCTGEMFVLKPDGDRADIMLDDSTHITAELITVDEERIFLRLESGWDALQVPEEEKIVGLPTRSVAQVEILGYSNKNWVTPWVALEVVPAVLLSVTVGVYNNSFEDALKGMLILGGIAGLNGLILSVSTPTPPRYANLQMRVHVDELKKYARFPQGLTPEQMSRFAATYGQERYRMLKTDTEAEPEAPEINE